MIYMQFGRTPLQYTDNEEVAAFLIDNGAKINKGDKVSVMGWSLCVCGVCEMGDG